MKILCGGPVSEDAEVFSAHLASLAAQAQDLDYKGIDNSPISLSPPDRGFGRIDWRRENGIGEYKQNQARWTEDRLKYLSGLREEMRLAALEGNYDHLFMVDSDQVLGLGTLTKMLSDEKPIVSGLVWTRYKPWTKRTWPNAWSLEGNGSNVGAHAAPSAELLARIEAGGLHEVEVTGGCYLLSRQAMELTSFASQPDMASEDVCFARTARASGIPICLDCDVKMEHRRRR